MRATIAPDAVGASELQGVSKLLFGQCKTDATEGSANVTSTALKAINCSITGVDSDDSALANRNSGNQCFDVANADTRTNLVIVWIRNDCSSAANVGTGMEISVLVYDK